MKDVSSTAFPTRRLSVWIVLLAYIIIVSLLTFPLIDWNTSMNFDTSVRLWVVQSPWQHLLHNIKYVELSPPAWHIGMKLLIQLSPIDPVVTIRGVNYLLYLALVPVGYLLGRRIYDDFTGLLAAGLLPLNQLVFDFTTRVDHYILFGVLTLVFSWSLLVWIQAPLKRRRVILHAAVTTFYGAVHYYAALYILAATSVALYLYWDFGFQRVLESVDRKRLNISSLSGTASRRTETLVGTHLPLGIFYIFWLPVFFSQYRAFRTTFGGQPNLALHKLVIRSIGLLRHFFAEAPYPRLVFAGIAFLILGLAMAGTYVNDNREIWTVVAGSSLTLGLVVASGGFYAPRHVFFLAGIVPVTLAAGVRYGLSFISDQTYTTVRSGIVVFGVGLLIILLVTPYVTTGGTFDPPERDTDLRGVTDFVAAHANSHTVIISSHPWGELILDTYGVARSVPVYGVPTDAVAGNHRIDPVRGRTRYSPSTHPSDYRKVRSWIEGAETVIIFDARGHPYGLYDPLLSDLRNVGYYCDRMTRSGDNGALVFRQGSSEESDTCETTMIHPAHD